MRVTCIAILLIFLNQYISCNQTSSEPEFDEIIRTEEAFLTWNGEYEVDGCGFIFNIDFVEFKASNEDSISSDFKYRDLMKVLIEFEDFRKKSIYYCGDLPDPQEFNLIKILSIEKLEWPKR